jgi:UDP-2,3-diacylglucosamine pyrophosphatase LpxH
MKRFVSDQDIVVLAALIDKGTQVKAAKALGINQGTLSERLKRIVRDAQGMGWMPDFGSHNKLPAGMRMKGVSAMVDDEGNVKQSWLKLEQDPEAGIRMLLDNLADTLASYKGVAGVPKKAAKTSDSDTMTWYPIGDHHFGMYAWAEETGVDYDTDIAYELLCKAINKLVNSAPPSTTAALLNVGDFFHMDNTKNVTNHSGNILDVDTRWAKVVQVGVNALRYAVDRMLQKHDTVHVYNVMGNHDTHSATALSMVIAALYEGNPRVDVHVTANPFQYHEFGKCMIGMHHGDTVKKRDQYVGIMARDQAEMWGRTSFRYWWLGHIHNSQREELPGVLVETFRTLAARDAWHASMGYGAGRDMTAIVLHKDYGEIERHTVPVQMIS